MTAVTNKALLPLAQSSPSEPLPPSHLHTYIYVPAQKIAVWVWNVVVYIAGKTVELLCYLLEKASLMPLVERIIATVKLFFEAGWAFSLAQSYLVRKLINSYVPDPLKEVAHACYIRLYNAWNASEMAAKVHELEAKLQSTKKDNSQLLALLKGLQDVLSANRTITQEHDVQENALLTLIEAKDQEIACLRDELKDYQQFTMMDKET